MITVNQKVIRTS